MLRCIHKAQTIIVIMTLCPLLQELYMIRQGQRIPFMETHRSHSLSQKLRNCGKEYHQYTHEIGTGNSGSDRQTFPVKSSILKEHVAPPAKPNCFCMISLSTFLGLFPLLLYWLMGTKHCWGCDNSKSMWHRQN